MPECKDGFILTKFAQAVLQETGIFPERSNPWKKNTHHCLGSIRGTALFFYFCRGEFICFVSPPPNNLIQINGAVPKTFCPSCCGETDIVMDPNPRNNRKRYTCIFNFLPVLVLPGQRLLFPPGWTCPWGSITAPTSEPQGVGVQQ